MGCIQMSRFILLSKGLVAMYESFASRYMYMVCFLEHIDLEESCWSLERSK